MSDKEVQVEQGEVDKEAVEEQKQFAASRKLAQTNHEASVAETERLNTPNDDDVKTEISARPEVEESDNPEQVDVSSEFPTAVAPEEPQDTDETPEAPVEE